MLRRVFLSLFLIFSMISLVNSAVVKVDVDVYKEFSNFKYNISLKGNESLDILSIERPKGSKVLSIQRGDSIISYTIAGDYFILKLNSRSSNENIILKFQSVQTSKNLIETNSFSNYVNFNFPINSLDYSVTIYDDFGTIEEIFPRNYEIEKENKVLWKVQNLEKDRLFLINFQKNSIVEKENNNNFFFENIILISIILLILILIVSIYSSKYLQKKIKEEIKPLIKKETQKVKKREEKKIQQKIKEELNKEKELKAKKEKILKKEIKKEEKLNLEIKEKAKKSEFEEIITKYLTENEREVVKIVKLHEGIVQTEILEFLTDFSKSNLSKIISKLHGKKFLNRIKVGKTNNIYLGEKLLNKTEE